MYGNRLARIPRTPGRREPIPNSACQTACQWSCDHPSRLNFSLPPGRVTILTEDGPSIRRIYTDGRPHSDDPDVTYTGESIGHWEEDTLVVDTKAISDKAQFMGGVNTSGHAHVV